MRWFCIDIVLQLFFQLHLSFEKALFEGDLLSKTWITKENPQTLPKPSKGRCWNFNRDSGFGEQVAFKQTFLEAQMELEEKLEHYFDAESSYLSIPDILEGFREL